MRQVQKKLLIWASIGLSLLVFGMLATINVKNKEKAIKHDYNIVKGSFVSYYQVGDVRTPYIKYSYYVNNQIYYRTVSGLRKYDYCYKNDKCKNKKFWVIYSIKNPKKSLIDLTTEIQDIENPIFPESKINFR